MKKVYEIKLQNGNTLVLDNVVDIHRYTRVNTAQELDKLLGLEIDNEIQSTIQE